MLVDSRWRGRAFRLAIPALALAVGLAFLRENRRGVRPGTADGPGATSAAGPATALGPVRRRAPDIVTEGRSSSVVGTPVPGPSLDLGAVMQQVHFAYRKQDGAWRGGHTTYEAALLPSGEVQVVPYHRRSGHDLGPVRPASHENSGRNVRREPGGGEVVKGDEVRLGPSSAARGGEVLAGGAGEPATDARGQLEIAKGPVAERLENVAEGISQSWRFARPPEGSGDLEVRVALAGGAFVGQTEQGLHFSGGKLGVRYGNATWIDALGVETAVPARWDGSAIVLRVPATVLDGSVYPAVLDPIISPELSMDAPVSGAPWSDQSFPALSSDGTDWLVVWQDYRGYASDIYGARVNASGAVLDPTGIPISKGPENEYEPGVAWNGTHYLVAWQAQGKGIRGARLSATGAVVDPAGFTISATGAAPTIAAGGSTFLVTWYDGRNGTNDIFCARVTGNAEVLDPSGTAVSTAPLAQVYPAAAWNGTDWLVVWYDYRTSANGTDVYGARVTGADGTVMDPAGIAVSVRAGYQSDPAVVWDGTNFMVVWSDTRNSSTSDDIYGARVSSAGVVVDAAGFPISTATGNQYYPAISWDGANHLVVWIDARTGNGKIYGARVTSAAAVLEPAGIPISLTAALPSRPAVGFNGTGFLAVWEDWRNNWKDVYGARVSGAGAVLDTPDVLIARSANAQHVPAVAWDGTNYLAVWQDHRSGSHYDIYGARLSGVDGSVLDVSGIAISTEANHQEHPAVAWNGSSYLVVWQDERSSTSYADVYGARVSADGAVLDPTGIGIATGPNDMGQVAVATDGAGFLVVWEESRPAPTYTDVMGARVSGAGTVLDSPPFVVWGAALGQMSPALAWNGTSYLVVWHEYRIAGGIYGARVSDAGVVLDLDAFTISGTASSYPAVAWDGTNHLVVWQDRRSGTDNDVYGARVDADGVVLDASGIAVSTGAGDQGLPALAWDGSTYLVAWQDLRSGTFLDVYAAQVTPGGAALDAGGFLVSGAPYDERGVVVVSPGPRTFLVAYSAFDVAAELGAWRVRARTVSFSSVPVAFAGSVTTAEDTAAGVTLTAADPELAPLTFSVVTPPAHGALTGTPPDLTYTPATDWAGSDSFTFKANDGEADSNVATVSISVTPVNDAPACQPQDVTVGEDAHVDVSLVATDVDGDALTYTVVTAPAHGTLSGDGASVTYMPAADFHGSDGFTFVAADGVAASNEAAVTITVMPVNDPPVALDQAVTVGEGGAIEITLAATDVEGDALTFAVVAQPAHGALTGSGALLTYTPAPGYAGGDTFTFEANDGAADSTAATVSISVTPKDEPAGGCGCGTSGEAAPLAVLLLAGLGIHRRRPAK